MLDAVVKEHGRLDILVNNAGITRDNLLMKMSEEDFDAVIQTNLKGVFNCTRHIARQMLKQKSGRIINISSVSGLFFRDKIIHRTPVYDARTFLNFGRNFTKPGEKQFFLSKIAHAAPSSSSGGTQPNTKPSPSPQIKPRPVRSEPHRALALVYKIVNAKHLQLSLIHI